MNNITIGLIGNPNSGKTTLFNQLTGARQHVGNWAGVTVERKEGTFSTRHHHVQLVDLPGTYSLTTISSETSLDEQITCHFILSGETKLVINVIDASNLERNLYLTLQLLELGVPCIVALNMLDIARSQHIHIDVAALAKRLGCPVIPVICNRGEGLDALRRAIDTHSGLAADFQLAYPPSVEENVQRLTAAMPQKISTRRRWLALQTLEGDIFCRSQCGEATALLPDLPGVIANPVDIAQTRYQTIERLCGQNTSTQNATPHRLSARLDALVLNRWLGIPVFLAVMYLMFFFAISLGGALQPLFEVSATAVFVHGVQWLGNVLHFPEAVTLFLAQGVGGGITTVMPLIPQIGLMYLFLSVMEDSGYMARAAFVVDRLMQALGLPGKSFVPLIVGFGCNVPAVMGARTLDAPRERLLTILMAPFMSCGARLAIFAVFASAFFGQRGASVVFSLYLLGITAAILTGLVLKNTLLRGEASPFVMELPTWHVPHLKSLWFQTWQRLKSFVFRAGKVIVVVSMFIGALNSFSFNGRPVSSINDSALASVSRQLTPLLSPMGVQADNWQATVGLITGAMAKEVVVGTLNTLYTAQALHEDAFNASEFSLLAELKDAVIQTRDSLRNSLSLNVLFHPIDASKGDGEMSSGPMGVMHSKFGSDFAAYSYLIFVLLYVPCVSVMGAVARESGRRWMLFSIFWGLNLAWSLATLFYQFATFAGHPLSSTVAVVAVVGFNLLVWLLLKRIRLAPLPLEVRMIPTTDCANCSKSGSCH
ncbi:Fe(2+) transporter permease subunit FeoB [Erwinia tracheiphila]|uniref:Ferrous iron transport protein B n=1 Tax=Erwinia tracheiphila TaxID=65700 RepID=A0A0M2KG53_9GAMM|nr:Fe(2+) transporter permease subunit FeoB [Erwinia tracheiphila]EOS95404.1 ferrous iron transport protein B [Erwinia tracheiphila PSU-1]KKF37924.1 ferrous iron transporter B [Erwinia tracheiphila]UIA88537.1 Fe(2+) transporter permease subunit FeoB [Erwinia tracheiphila]UIA96916.1 Fe(2+) transporter permease subunit FeoB [Erwinia tracheiphila]